MILTNGTGRVICDNGALLSIVLTALGYLPTIFAALASLSAFVYYTAVVWETKSFKRLVRFLRGSKKRRV